MNAKPYNRRSWIAKTKAVMLAMHVTPNGADQPLPPLPSADVDPERKTELKLWDRLMPKFRGLLEARVKGKQRFDE